MSINRQKQKKSTLKKWLPAIILALFIHLILVAVIFYTNFHKTKAEPKDAVVITPVAPIKPIQQIPIAEIAEKTPAVSSELQTEAQTTTTSKKPVNTTEKTKPLSNQQDKQTNQNINKEKQESTAKSNKTKQTPPKADTQQPNAQINHENGDKTKTPQQDTVTTTQPPATKKNSGSPSLGRQTNNQPGGNTVGLIKGIDVPANDYQDPTSVLQGNYKKVNELKTKVEAIKKEEKMEYEKISDGAIAIKEFNKQNIAQAQAKEQEDTGQ